MKIWFVDRGATNEWISMTDPFREGLGSVEEIDLTEILVKLRSSNVYETDAALERLLPTLEEFCALLDEDAGLNVRQLFAHLIHIGYLVGKQTS